MITKLNYLIGIELNGKGASFQSSHLKKSIII